MPLPDVPEAPEEPEEVQAPVPESAIVTAIVRAPRRTVVLFIRPTPMRLLCSHANAGHGRTPEKARAPQPRKVAGPVLRIASLTRLPE
ncbi:hypothetical protein GCM10010121_032640 [Streptomyces brasiliensis]|uniref:Uncharacterized protein n=1 Tax=Streptomyces brasiliensis TaxID=1954 RepID=A0A917KML4_9ACTN|nr:hypothetical protein GCM10010121_032640 [Streptomyces brasiliensis]